MDAARAAALQAAERLQAALARPFPIEGREVFLPASIGIALASPDHERPEDLLRDADMAMYRAKNEGRARHAIFDHGMHVKAVARLELETDLRRALDRGEMRVFYQPIVSLTTGRITGMEALVRWQHARRGLLAPDLFIPAAEETGLIVPLGAWILAQACAQARAWQDRFPDYAARLSVSVNLSARQMGTSTSFLALVEAALEDTGLPAHDLHLEATETSLMEADGAAFVLAQLVARGIRIALDDFGTGYSSLSYLHRFPITHLKIDRSFVREMPFRGEEAAIVRAIVTMAQSLNIAVVAEGIETPDQLSVLRALGCDFGQGYLFAPPLPASEAHALLARAPVW